MQVTHKSDRKDARIFIRFAAIGVAFASIVVAVVAVQSAEPEIWYGSRKSDGTGSGPKVIDFPRPLLPPRNNPTSHESNAPIARSLLPDLRDGGAARSSTNRPVEQSPRNQLPVEVEEPPSPPELTETGLVPDAALMEAAPSVSAQDPLLDSPSKEPIAVPEVEEMTAPPPPIQTIPAPVQAAVPPPVEIRYIERQSNSPAPVIHLPPQPAQVPFWTSVVVNAVTIFATVLILIAVIAIAGGILFRRYRNDAGLIFRVEVVNANAMMVQQVAVPAIEATGPEFEIDTVPRITPGLIDSLPFVPGLTFEDEIRKREEESQERDNALLKEIFDQNVQLRNKLAALPASAA